MQIDFELNQLFDLLMLVVVQMLVLFLPLWRWVQDHDEDQGRARHGGGQALLHGAVSEAVATGGAWPAITKNKIKTTGGAPHSHSLVPCDMKEFLDWH